MKGGCSNSCTFCEYSSITDLICSFSAESALAISRFVSYWMLLTTELVSEGVPYLGLSSDMSEVGADVAFYFTYGY